MKQARNPAALLAAVEARDLTTRELALLTDCPETTIRLILAGTPTTPTRARRLARVLRRRVGELFAAAASNREQQSGHPGAVA